MSLSINIAGTVATEPMEFTVHNRGTLDFAWVGVSDVVGSPPADYVKSYKVAVGAISQPIQLGAGQFACVFNDSQDFTLGEMIAITGTNVTVTGGATDEPG